ncbi:hypothetical protein ACKWTF_003280 [Chironomus riparius]
MLKKTILIYCAFILSDASANAVEKTNIKQQYHDKIRGPEARFITTMPQTQKQAEIVHYEYKHLPENRYSLYYETTDGQMRYEYGFFKDDENFEKILNVRGFYGFYDDRGERHFVRYSADENGYRYQQGEPYFDYTDGPPTVENTLFDGYKNAFLKDAKLNRK